MAEKRRTLAFGAALSQGDWPCQEDGYFIHPWKNFFAVADGFGGKGAGDLAAKLALQQIKAHLLGEESKKDPQVSAKPSDFPALFSEINQGLLQRNEKLAPQRRGGCSLLCASISENNSANLFYTGACSAYVFRSGALFSVVLPQADFSASDPFALPQFALGIETQLQVGGRQISLYSGDILLLGSSGFVYSRELLQMALGKIGGARQIGSAGLAEGARAILEQSGEAAGATGNRGLVLVEA